MTLLSKIPTIGKFGSFQNFEWSKCTANALTFQRLNFIFGRNYSGKTTLSKIVQALERQRIPEHYDGAKFELEFNDGTVLNQDQISLTPTPVRVFNRDFVSDNLSFLGDTRNENGQIVPFAVLGERNKDLEEQITAKSDTLGIDGGERSTGLYAKCHKLSVERQENQELHAEMDREITKIKQKISNDPATGIKYRFNIPNYSKTKLDKDIEDVSQEGYRELSENDVKQLKAVANDKVRAPVSLSDLPPLKMREILQQAELLLRRKVFQGEAIAEFLNDADRENWARTGFDLHKKNHSVCAFCGQPMPDERWQKLRAHFENECEELHKAIEDLLDLIKAEYAAHDSCPKIFPSDFYAEFWTAAEQLRSARCEALETYRTGLNVVRALLEKRRKAIASPCSDPLPGDPTPQLESVWRDLRSLVETNNAYATRLASDQVAAGELLRLHQVAQAMKHSGLRDKLERLSRLEEECARLEKPLNEVREQIEELRGQLAELRRRRHDESKAAELINSYLTWNGERNALKLQIEERDEDGVTSKFFRVVRNGKPAYNLSEGECNLIAFCYFLATLSSPELERNKPIIWIDDPISSLDLNHIYFVYALIRAVILNDKKYGQLFISTHNLEFLRYMQRIADWDEKRDPIKGEWFFVHRTTQGSVVERFPKYLKNYITEFAYLFTQIYNAAEAEPDTPDYENFIYGFGNAARRFLEIYLYFKFPNDIADRNDEHTRRMTALFGDKVKAFLVDRVMHELSHEPGAFERAMTPVDSVEIHDVAREILRAVKDNDPTQYEHLLRGIGKGDLLED